MFHTVTEYSREGEELKTYETIADAIKETGESRSSILSQINGERKYCFWFSHIYYNDIVLLDGRVIKQEKPKMPTVFELAGSFNSQIPIFDDDEQANRPLIERLGLSPKQVAKIVSEWYTIGDYADILQDEDGRDLEEIMDDYIYD
jgi:hypothetical protein